MTFGEKLQRLRKENGLSQEDLADRLGVSRQAVSRWEQGASLPDTENVVGLGKLLSVTTDFLLTDAPTDQTPQARKAALRDRAAFFAGLGLCVMGLLVTWVGWTELQRMLPVALGLCVQLAGVALFSIYNSMMQQKSSRVFYAISCWLVAPYPIYFLVNAALGLYPKPYSSWLTLVVPGLLYLLVCATVTVLLLRKKR